MKKNKKIFYGVGIVWLAVWLAGCSKKPIVMDKTPYETKECSKALAMGLEFEEEKKIDKLMVYKSKRRLYAYRDGKEIYEFRISLGKNGDKGHKIKQGDLRTPEGNYIIVRKKCDPRLYRSLMISYPNEKDKAIAKIRGLNPGGYITIHGQPKWNANGDGDSYTFAHDWTEGCIALSNRAADMLWSGVANGTAIEIYQ